MRIFAMAVVGCAVALGTWACGTAPASSTNGGGIPGAGPAADGGAITGFAFVD